MSTTVGTDDAEKRPAFTFTRRKTTTLASGSSTEASVSTTVGIPAHHLLPDIPSGEGPLLRLQVYRQIWSSILSRIKDLAAQIQGDAVQKGLDGIEDAFSAEVKNPLLPFDELPTIVFTGSESIAVDRVSREVQFRTQAIRSVVPVKECNTVQNMIKAIIAGFVSHPDTPPQPKRKASSTLAAYDINLLRSWYRAMIKIHENLILVVVLPRIESLASNIIHDVIHILSTLLPEVRLTLLTQSTNLFNFQSRLPYSALRLLRPLEVAVPCGYNMIERILEETFYDPFNEQIDPELIFPPEAMKNALDFAEKTTNSLDGVVSYLQITILHHFSNPHTLIMSPSFDPSSLPTSSSSSQADDQFTAFLRVYLSPSPPTSESIEDARTTIRRTHTIYSCAFHLLRIVQRALQKEEAKQDNGGKMDPVIGWNWRMLLDEENRDKAVDVYCSKLCELDRELLHELLVSLLTAIQEFPDEWQSESEAGYLRPLAPLTESQSQSEAEDQVDSVKECLLEFFDHSFENSYEKLTLNHVFCIGPRDVASPLLDPAPFTTTVAALRSSQILFERLSVDDDNSEKKPNALDTTLLFEGYNNAGRIINIWDWFGDFRARVRAQEKAKERENRRKKSVSPTKRKKRGRPPKKDKVQDPEEGEGEDEVQDKGEEEDTITPEIQARFLRALHEFDYMGFIRGAGRTKRDVVARNYFFAES